MNVLPFHREWIAALTVLLCLPALPHLCAEEPGEPRGHEAFDWKKFPHSKDFEIPAAATQSDPMHIARVTAGQTVTLSIRNVHWSGGGTKGKTPTDYRGYRDRREHNGLPWMALVAGIGSHHFLPDHAEYSFTVPEDGELVLFANDDRPDGNVGRAKVTVKIE